MGVYVIVISMTINHYCMIDCMFSIFVIIKIV